MLLSFGDTTLVAPLSNAMSALCGGITVGLLYASLRLLGVRRLGAATGALCYLFADSVWFSATESEVYAMAMLFCSLDVYVALRYRLSHNTRLLSLIGLLLGLGAGVHLMTLLTVPALLIIILPILIRYRRWGKTIPAAMLFFTLGLTPYLIIPIRAAANPPINELGKDFGSYLRREQYPKAPLYPRMWREKDSTNWREWNMGCTDILGNAVFYGSYQLGYMYGRYLMYNYVGRENLAYRPNPEKKSVFNFHYSIFILPALMGLWGLVRHRRRSRSDFWTVMLLFLFGGVILNLYLNHPCYEPRERDYVYVLSYYAFAIWIGLGADDIASRLSSRFSFLILLAPLLMAIGNWRDHDRSHSHAVHDIAMNHLESCDPDAILITLGDNDTFPLWYLQQVERQRTDIDIYNVGLTGWGNIRQMLYNNNYHRPVYFSQYFYERFGQIFPDQLRCEGFCWRLLPDKGGDLTPILHPAAHWHITQDEYTDPIAERFLDIWQRNTGTTIPRL